MYIYIYSKVFTMYVLCSFELYFDILNHEPNPPSLSFFNSTIPKNMINQHMPTTNILNKNNKMFLSLVVPSTFWVGTVSISLIFGLVRNRTNFMSKQCLLSYDETCSVCAYVKPAVNLHMAYHADSEVKR